MEINIFKYNLIPIILFSVGLLIIIISMINFSSSRKVTLKERTGAKKSIFFNVGTNYFLKKFRKFKRYNSLLDKAQFAYGYFSATSEKTNKEKAEKLIIKTILINLLFLVAIIVFDVLWVIKFFAIILIVLVEYMYISTSITKKKNKLQEQFPLLVRGFIEGYVLTSNVKASFERAGKELSPIYQVQVNKLITQLSSATGSDEAFNYFNKRLDYPMASLFVSIVQSAYSTKKNVVENLLELQTMLNDETSEIKSSKNRISSSKNINILWAVSCIIELFAVGYYAKTTTGNYFLTTSMGQLLLLCTIGAIILAIACIRIAESV